MEHYKGKSEYLLAIKKIIPKNTLVLKNVYEPSLEMLMRKSSPYERMTLDSNTMKTVKAAFSNSVV